MTNIKKRQEKNRDLQRRFTVRALTKCELMRLSIDDIDKMKTEFPDVFDELFTNSFRRLKIELQLKIDAIK